MKSAVYVALAALASLFGAATAWAQTGTLPLVVTTCGTVPSGFYKYTAGLQAPLTVDVNGNICGGSGGSISGTSALNAISALPTLSAGSQVPQGSLAGAAYVQPVFSSTSGGGTQVDASHGLPVNVIAGGGGGTSSTFGSAFPATGTAIGLSNGTNMIALTEGQAAMTASVPVTIASNQSVLEVGPTTSANTTANPFFNELSDGTHVNTLKAASTASVAGDTSLVVQLSPNQAALTTPLNVSLAADQSVNVAQVNGVTTLTGAGATGTGAQRVTASQDTTTIAGSAPGTAGSASANVITVQGVTSMTPVQVSVPPSSAATIGITPVVSASAESSHVLKGSPGNLYSLYATISGTSGYLMTFNATSAPADGAVTPVECVVAPSGSTTSISVSGSPPDVYSTGITAVFSSTGCFTKTASATAFFKGRVQ